MSTAMELLEYLNDADPDEALDFAEQMTPARTHELKSPRADIEAFNEAVRKRINDEAGAPHQRLKSWLFSSVHELGARWEEQLPGAEPGPKAPVWRSGLASLDALTGGGSGYVCYAGVGGCGKTLQAFRSAVECCRQGWRVVYVNTEMSHTENAALLRRCCGGTVGPQVLANMRIVNVLSGMTVQEVADEVGRYVERGDERLLIVLDSLDRLAKKDPGRGSDFWVCLERWAEFARLCALNSNGKISVIAVREMGAKTGADKGQSAAFDSNLLLTMQKTEDRDTVKIRVAKCRYGRDGDLGSHYRDWAQAQFVPCGDVEL